MDRNEMELQERRRNIALGLIVMPLLESWTGAGYRFQDGLTSQMNEESLDQLIKGIKDEGGDVLEMEEFLDPFKDKLKTMLISLYEELDDQ